MSICKLGPFEHTQSMFKQPTGSAYIDNSISYLLYLPVPFPRGLCKNLEGGSTFPPLTLLMHIDRLGLFSHLHRVLLNCLSACSGSWVGTTTLYIEVGWYCTIAVSAWCSVHQLPWCECTGNRSHAPFGCQNGAYMGIYAPFIYIQPYAAIYTCIYKYI